MMTIKNIAAAAMAFALSAFQLSAQVNAGVRADACTEDEIKY